jgi:myo-inositol-1(or 4)-monophosphatase
MTHDLQEYLEFATETAYLAGRLTLGHFQVGIRADRKSDATPVTAADRQAEALIRSRIEHRYADHGIVGEEYPEKRVSSEVPYRWFVDPIDGTQSFVHGVPLYAVLIGLEIEGTVRVGAAYYPALDEMLCAATGEGCWWNGRRTFVSSVDRLDQAALTFTGLPNLQSEERRAAWDNLLRRVGYCAGWTDAYGYLLVATGRTEVALDPVMASWDCGPFPPILQEAGGYFGDWKGNRTIYGGEALATNNALLPQVLSIMNGPASEPSQ